MVANSNKVDILIDEIRKFQWESINDISDKYMIDIVKYRLTSKEDLNRHIMQFR